MGTHQKGGRLDYACAHCGKEGDRSVFWFTDIGWLCDTCFASYIKIPEEAKRKLFKKVPSSKDV
jgi:hypothetical protein